MFDQVLERSVRHLCLVGPSCITEYPLQALRIDSFDTLESIEQRAAHITRGSAHISPVRSLGNIEAIVGGSSRVVSVARVVERLLIVFVPNVAQTLEEEKRKDVLFVVTRVDQTAQ